MLNDISELMSVKEVAMTRCRFLLILIFLGLGCEVEAASFPLIVQIPATISIDSITAALPNSTVVGDIPGANTYLLNVQFLPPPATASQLGIQWMELNRTVNLPRFGLNGGVVTVPGASDWYRRQPAMQLINTAKASAFSTGRGIVVADLNSKIDYAHPALVGHLTSGYDFFTSGVVTPAIMDQAEAGFLEQAEAGFLEQAEAGFLEQAEAGFLEQFGSASLDALNPADIHGTLSAGIIAAMAPDSMIMPLHVFGDDGRSDLFSLAKAIRYAVDHGAQIINLNFGTVYISLAIQSAVQFAQASNVILVAPAGNGQPAGTSQLQYPAAFNGVMTAAATDLSDTLASFSNYGSDVFVAAPGVQVISAYPGGYYTVGSGTSLSAAAVAGTGALVRSLRTNGVSDSIARAAVNIDPRNPNFQNQLGHGRIDVLQSVILSQSPTTTSITSPTVTYNAAGVVTVTVTSSAATPPGQVSLKVDGGSTMSAALSAGSATFTINGLNAGDHTLTASYAAQGAFSASSTTGTLHVDPRPITVSADSKSKTYGTTDPLLTYQITSGSLVNGDSFTGNLTRAAGDDAGTYRIQQGTLALSANYGLTFVGADFRIIPAPTATAISSAPNPSTFGQAVLLTATVNSTSAGAGIPPGSVTFYDGAATIGTSPLNASGVATVSTSELVAGTHTITAAYRATSNFSASTSPATMQSVNQANTSTTLTSSLKTSSVGTTVTFTAIVNAVSPGAGRASGKVTFTDGKAVLAIVAVNGSGRATLATSSLTVDEHSIRAAYKGDSNFTMSTSAPLSQIIYAYPTRRADDAGSGGGGTFVIGDIDVAIGKQVTFWNAKWNKLNSLSGGPAPTSFKGFANSPSTQPPSAGGTWTTDRDDDDSVLPTNIPAYMAVIVSSSITKSGSTISGNISRMMVVGTAPGFKADSSRADSRAGTGKVVAIIAP
jgi:hypothetical protein